MNEVLGTLGFVFDLEAEGRNIPEAEGRNIGGHSLCRVLCPILDKHRLGGHVRAC